MHEGAILIAVHGKLVRAVGGCEILAVRVGSEDAKKEHCARSYGLKRADVVLQLAAADFGRHVHPEVHLRQIEFAGSARNALAASGK